MKPALRQELEAALGAPIEGVHPLRGGDINEAWKVALRGGRTVFVKTHEGADPEMFLRESEGLAWLAEARALRVPEVLAVSASFLALELIESGRRAADFDERLGRGLAALHRHGAEGFGWREDNFIGSLPQDNGREPDWASFYVRRRLEPQLRMARERGLATSRVQKDFARLFNRIEALLGPAEPPARLHGDLWSGNCHVAADGAPVLIDPAVYGGHREVDLAMMQLFGGFSERVFAAYDEAWPLEEGWRERTPLHQLYPLMVHVNLFGGSYVAGVERILASLA